MTSCLAWRVSGCSAPSDDVTPKPSARRDVRRGTVRSAKELLIWAMPAILVKSMTKRS